MMSKEIGDAVDLMLENIKAVKGPEHLKHVTLWLKIRTTQTTLEGLDPLQEFVLQDTLTSLFAAYLGQFTLRTGKEVKLKEVEEDAYMIYSNTADAFITVAKREGN